jgi:hypothetical protein
MKRKRWIIAAAALSAVITSALLIGRFYVLGSVLNARLERLFLKTGIHVTYESIEVSLKGAVVRNIALHFQDEKQPFAKTDAATMDWSHRVVKIDDIRISRDGVTAAARGNFHVFKNSMDVEMSMPPMACADFLKAIPEKFRDKMVGLTVQGKLAFDLHFRLNSDQPKRNLLDGDLDNGCSIKDFGAVPVPDTFRKPFKQRVYDPKKKPFDIITGPGTDHWVDFGLISRYMTAAVLEAEDPLFYQHSGIMLSRVETAARINLARGVLRYGASTITMQTAKNLFLSRDKTVARKLQEVFFVWYLESNFTKDEILALYLNLAEFGPSLYGVKNAAEYYFGLLPKDLNLRQSAFLAKLLPNPTERYRAKDLGTVPDDLARRVRALLLDMKKNKRITKEEYDDALSEKISFDKPDATRAAGASASSPDISASHVTRASRPRLFRPLAPWSKIISDRNVRGKDLAAEAR